MSEQAHQIVLREQRAFLVDHMYIRDIMDHMIASGCFNQDERETINAIPEDRQKCRKLLDILELKNKTVFIDLVEALVKTGSDFIADTLTKHLEGTQSQTNRQDQIGNSGNSKKAEDEWFEKLCSIAENKIPSDRELTLIGLELPGPDVIGSMLGLSHSTIQQCKANACCETTLQTVAVLQAWKRQFWEEANMKTLLKALDKSKLLTEGVRCVIDDACKET